MKAQTLVERLFVVSLHRAVEDAAPEELEILRAWFDPGDRRSRYHIAPVIGALGYLRKNPDRYREIMHLAGRYASQWTFDDLSNFRRRLIRSFLWLGRDCVRRRLLRSALRRLHRDGELRLTREDGKLVVTLSNSLFCRAGSGNGTEAVCLYYASLFSGLLEQVEAAPFHLIESRCRRQGADICRFEGPA